MAAMIETEGRRARKSEAAFRTISEVSSDLDVPQHVLRFWETKFPQVRPLKRGGGRRYYRPEDVILLRRVRDLLYREGYTIKGVQRLLRDTARESLRDGPPRDAPREQREPEHAIERRAEPRLTPQVIPDEPKAEAPASAAAEAALSPALKAELSALLDELIAVREILKGAAEK
jgi:DNA-binding transcriptional MerR regulator